MENITTSKQRLKQLKLKLRIWSLDTKMSWRILQLDTKQILKSRSYEIKQAASVLLILCLTYALSACSQQPTVTTVAKPVIMCPKMPLLVTKTEPQETGYFLSKSETILLSLQKKLSE